MRKRIAVMAVAVVWLLTLGLAGCGGGPSEELKNPDVLNIVMPDLGYGTEWMTSVANGFTEKTGIKCNVDVTPTESSYVASIRGGVADYDIYLIRGDLYSIVTSNGANFSGEDVVLAELDDVYNSEIPGENRLFKDKMKSVYERYNRIDIKGDGNYHYYGVQWCDSCFSLVRNLDVWKDEWKIPNTSDELIALCRQIKSDPGSYYPMIWSAQATYMNTLYDQMVVQYQGVEDMYGEKGFWNGYDEDGDINTPDMWRRQGFYEALCVLDELVNKENNFQHPLSLTQNFTTCQGYFLTPTSKIAMMVNGDWLYSEMHKNYPDANLEMLKMPIISAIIKHPDCEGTIENDAELSALIAAIDRGETALTGEGYSVSQKAFDKILEARDMYTPATNINHVMISPSYSDSLEQVKQFYLYLASDEGLKKFSTGGGGFRLGFDSSPEVIANSEAVANDFVKSCLAVKGNRTVAAWAVNSSRLFSLGGMPNMPMIELGYQWPELIFSLDKNGGYKTPAEVYARNYINAVAKWATFMTTAGLS